MAEKDKLDVTLGGDLSSKHLLALVIELNGIKESQADRKLQVGAELIRQWRDELVADGLIDIPDPELEDTPLVVTKKGLKKMGEVRTLLLQDSNLANPPTGPSLAQLGLRARTKMQSFAQTICKIWMDFLILSSTIFSLYLLKVFIEEPNTKTTSFLFGSIILSIVLLMYHQYRKDLKTREFIGFLRWSLKSALLLRKYALLSLVIILVIYVVGMVIVNPINLSFYFFISVFAASTGYLIYFPKKTIFSTLLFYVGVTLMSVGLMAISDLASPTELLLVNKSRLIDIIFGLGVLLVVSMNERGLGLTVLSPLKKT